MSTESSWDVQAPEREVSTKMSWKSLKVTESHIRCQEEKAHGACACAVRGEGDRGWRDLLRQKNNTRSREGPQAWSLLRGVQQGCVVKSSCQLSRVSPQKRFEVKNPGEHLASWLALLPDWSLQGRGQEKDKKKMWKAHCFEPNLQILIQEKSKELLWVCVARFW